MLYGSPHLISDIKSIENVQRDATRMISSLRNWSYKEHLQLPKLPSLSYRRLRDDLILVYIKAIRNLSDPLNKLTNAVTDPVHQTGGHKFKLKKSLCHVDAKKHSFPSRIMSRWNNL